MIIDFSAEQIQAEQMEEPGRLIQSLSMAIGDNPFE
jgi:hypothetical protein